MDGHDKLMGYQNSTFPLAIYGSIDTASRKILWLKIWTGNADPKRIARWYLEHLYETGQLRPTLESIEEIRLELWRQCTRIFANPMVT